jgi:hypothetical protein
VCRKGWELNFKHFLAERRRESAERSGKLEGERYRKMNKKLKMEGNTVEDRAN